MFFTVLLFIIILSVLVVAHEFGHFAAARACGMRVREFGLGFPPRIFGVYKDSAAKKFVWVNSKNNAEEFSGTVYSLNWLPLGGFCNIKGENGEEANDPDSFGFHKPHKRSFVLVAGVAMNMLFAAFLLSAGNMIGIPTDVSYGIPRGAIVVEQPSVVVQEVVKDSSAERSGIKFGDKIFSVDGHTVLGITDFTDYVANNANRDLSIAIRRGNENINITARPSLLAGGDAKPRLGVMLASAAVLRYPWHIAVWQGFSGAFVGLWNIFTAFYILIKQLVLGRGLAFDVSGPVGIASVVGQSARLGFHYVISVTAMISLSLAAINILPIPALDGGRILFVAAEKIFRRKIPMKYEQLAHTIGFALLMVLVVVVTGRDVMRIFG